MKERRKRKLRRRFVFVIYLLACLVVIVAAYFQLRKTARDYNTQHLELITGLYAEKMNESMEYLRSFAREDVKMIQAMDDVSVKEIYDRLQANLSQTVFCNMGLILKNGDVLGDSCVISDIQKKKLDEEAKSSSVSFVSDPYQSSETGNIVMTVFVPVEQSANIQTLYASIQIEDIRQLGVYELLKGKINVHLLKADSENFITCISSDTEVYGSWNNLLLQQKYFSYDDDYTYSQWIRDMRQGKKEGRFSAKIRGEESTISYRNISSMPGWYVVVELTNKNVSDITQQFSIWGVVYGSILLVITILLMLIVLFWERADKKKYMGLSATDPLTGVLNRRAFQEALERALAQKVPGCFIFMDVDDFKHYNDTYGHNSGDVCLKYFAQSMKNCFPQEGILGRYGGDEFVVYLPELSEKEAEGCMQRFQEAISHLKLPTGDVVKLTTSAGGALSPEQGEDFVSLCRSADLALYEVKQHGKGAFKMHA